ncbi:hypothetical protein DD596_25325 [Enterobacter cloacae complex sp. 4DZ3-28B]|nr:hypothetical protein DD596_25325 [Enterobacter cloacae complex sp. 4DZ3-28B]
MEFSIYIFDFARFIYISHTIFFLMFTKLSVLKPIIYDWLLYDLFTNCINENMHIFDESFENGTNAISSFCIQWISSIVFWRERESSRK